MNCSCGNISENKDTGKCASCAHAERRAEKQALKVKVVTPVKKISAKRKEENKEYTPLKKQFLIDNPECQIKLIGCTKVAVDVHHCAKRGINFLNVKTWKSGCRWCHDIVETKLSAEERRERGLLI
jgi:hypothetical protein